MVQVTNQPPAVVSAVDTNALKEAQERAPIRFDLPSFSPADISAALNRSLGQGAPGGIQSTNVDELRAGLATRGTELKGKTPQAQKDLDTLNNPNSSFDAVKTALRDLFEKRVQPESRISRAVERALQYMENPASIEMQRAVLPDALAEKLYDLLKKEQAARPNANLRAELADTGVVSGNSKAPKRHVSSSVRNNQARMEAEASAAPAAETETEAHRAATQQLLAAPDIQITNPEPDVRKNAIDYLDMITRNRWVTAKDAASRYVILANDSNAEVQKKAVESLSKLDGGLDALKALEQTDAVKKARAAAFPGK